MPDEEVDAEIVNPWDRQPNEPPKEWDRFTIYRDMGPGHRSLAKCGEIAGVHETTIEKHSSQWDWGARVAAWDAHNDKLAQAEYERENRAVRERHVQDARGNQDLARMAITAWRDLMEKWIEKRAAYLSSPETEPNPGNPPIPIADAIRMGLVGQDAELRAMGNPDLTIAHGRTSDERLADPAFSPMLRSPEVKEAMLALTEAAAAARSHESRD